MKDVSITALTLDNLAEWPLLIKWLIIIFGFLLILVLGYYVDIKNQKNFLRIKQQQAVTLKQELLSKNQHVAKLSVYKNQTQALQTILIDLLGGQTNQKRFAGLLEDIAQAGAMHGLEFKMVKPLAEKTQGLVVESPIEISALGSYSQLVGFMSELAQLPHIAVINDFVLERMTGEKLELNMMLVAYGLGGSKEFIKKSMESGLIKNTHDPFQSHRNASDQLIEPLQAFSLSSLKMTGSLRLGDKTWALIMAPDGRMYSVTVGDRIAKDKSKVIAVDANQIIINEQGRKLFLPLMTAHKNT
jgi:type IV pilus assembly protein PilO